MCIKKIKDNGVQYLLVLVILMGMLTVLGGCIGEDASKDKSDWEYLVVLTETEGFNDSHIFSEGVYLAYEKEYQYSFNITNNTESLHLNYTFTYRFEEPMIGPAGQLSITWSFYDDEAEDSFILHQITTETTIEENGTTVYYDAYLEGIENLTGDISVRINGNGSDNTLTGGTKDYFELISKMTYERLS